MISNVWGNYRKPALAVELNASVADRETGNISTVKPINVSAVFAPETQRPLRRYNHIADVCLIDPERIHSKRRRRTYPGRVVIVQPANVPEPAHISRERIGISPVVHHKVSNRSIRCHKRRDRLRVRRTVSREIVVYRGRNTE